MTTKEELQKLAAEVKPYSATLSTFKVNPSKLNQVLEDAVKELEVLEILKKYFRYDFEKSEECYIWQTFWKTTVTYGEFWEKHNEEYEKIKEWLKDGH